MHYRLYILGQDSRIVRGIDLECDSDDDALVMAAEQEHLYGLELWKGREPLMQRGRDADPAPVVARETPPRPVVPSPSGTMPFLARCRSQYAGGLLELDP